MKIEIRTDRNKVMNKRMILVMVVFPFFIIIL